MYQVLFEIYPVIIEDDLVSSIKLIGPWLMNIMHKVVIDKVYSVKKPL